LSVAGFTNTPFTFYGFLAKKGVQRLGALREMTQGAHASVFFESPFRIQKTLAELASLSPTRLGFVGREMTKMHEEYIHGTLEDLSKIFSSKSPKGEFTVCIAGRTKRELRELKRNLDKMEK
jgi:16S rRNA (cytidine1402-2'-O)-methyltransferase